MVTCDEDLDVSTAYCKSSLGDEVDWLWNTDRAQSFFSDWTGFESFN